MDKVSQINSLVRSKSRNELVMMCKEKNLPYSGTKHDMAVRLIGGLSEPKQIHQQIRKIIIPRINGKWIFQDIVFDDKTKIAVSRLMPDGSLGSLQRSQIEICKQYKFKYKLPDILDDRPDPPEKNNSYSSDEEEEEEDLVEEEEDIEN